MNSQMVHWSIAKRVHFSKPDYTGGQLKASIFGKKASNKQDKPINGIFCLAILGNTFKLIRPL